MIGSDIEFSKQLYLECSNKLSELIALAENGAWDDVHELLPNTIAQMKALPIIDPQVSENDAKAIAELLNNVQNQLVQLEPYLRTWQDELAKMLQGFANENKLFNAYGA